MKKKYLISIGLIVLVLAGGFYYFNKNTEKLVTIDGKQFNIELAKTDAEREKGLMNRDHLDANSGMLFVFNKSEIQTFWMKNTKIPLDIIWINRGRIVEKTTLDPDSPNMTPQYTPKEKANYVLELNAGISAENDFKIGDKVKINY